jgi:hypothetical protein
MKYFYIKYIAQDPSNDVSIIIIIYKTGQKNKKILTIYGLHPQRVEKRKQGRKD